MSDSFRSNRNTGPRNSDGTLVGGVAVGPYKPFPFPVGYTQGELTVKEWRNRRRGKSTAWDPWVECSCGWEGFVCREDFKSGRTSRCNFCAKKATGITVKKFRGYAAIVPDDYHRERLLNRISSCIQRCHNPKNKQFVHYGGRGIRVSPEWREDRTKFLGYLCTLAGWDVAHLELDREDNDKGYEPGNLRFITRAKNAGNRGSMGALRQELSALRKENDDLRHRLRRAEEQVHNLIDRRAADRP